MNRTPSSDPRSSRAGLTLARAVALATIGVLALALAFVRISSRDSELSVPDGARPGDLILQASSYATEAGSYPADSGVLVVPENRDDPRSRLIALPVTRIRARSEQPAEPVFHLEGGPGRTNLVFPTANRIADNRDVVLVGYRGVEGPPSSIAPRSRRP
jgi:hypothetical protein